MNLMRLPTLLLVSCLALSLSVPLLAAEEEGITISRQEWSLPHSGESLIQDQKLRALVAQLLADEKRYLEIRYPGGDEGTLWVKELQAWLVALGVDSNIIDLFPGSAERNFIHLRVIDGVPFATK